MPKQYSFLVFVLVLFCIQTRAQEIAVHGHFLADSAKIGERIPYWLSVRHPSSQSVVFPDSVFSFAPFEFERKVYFPTQTRSQVSTDSAVYYLSTFEIDSIQTLGLPVFVLHQGDCTSVYAQPDTIRLVQLVGVVPQNIEGKDLPLKSNADYLNVGWLLNYPLLLLAGGIFIVVLIVLWVIFGKRIRRYYRLKRLMKSHSAFVARFKNHLESLRTNSSYTEAELALVDWKKYMEGLIGKPYTKFTTKEILRLVQDPILGEALHHIDRMVYARGDLSSTESFDRLLSFSQDQYTKRAEEVKRG